MSVWRCWHGFYRVNVESNGAGLDIHLLGSRPRCLFTPFVGAYQERTPMARRKADPEAEGGGKGHCGCHRGAELMLLASWGWFVKHHRETQIHTASVISVEVAGDDPAI